MAYDEILGLRISALLLENQIDFIEKKMMGGLCYMVDDKMLCGLLIDKRNGENLLMSRIGETAYETEIEKSECMPMDFTGRPMKGYVFVLPEGFTNDKNLWYWLALCIQFNPLAKSSKRTTKKSVK